MTTTKEDCLNECKRLIASHTAAEGIDLSSLDGFIRAAWPCDDEPADLVGQFVEEAGTRLIEAALSSCDALCCAERPCAAVVNYEPEEDSEEPWRVSDDWYSTRFPTVAKAVEFAKTWYEG